MPNIQVKNIENREQWEKFVDYYAPDTFLHSWEWGLSQRVLKNKVFFLGIFNDEKLAGAALVYKVNAKRGSFLFCPHGPLIDWSNEAHFGALLKHCIALARDEKVDFIRISPLAPNSENISKIFKKYKFRDAPIHMMHPETAWMLDISAPPEELLKNMKKRHRYSIKKAKKDGVKIVKTKNIADIEKFYQVYIATANRQGFVPFSKEYIKKEFEIFTEKDKALLFLAYYRKELVATAVIIFSRHSAFYHHGASIRKYANIPASELLQWETIRECQKRGIKKYNFWGVVPENLTKHPWVGLSRFKRGFGGYEEEYLHVQDLPLTYKYWLNYAVEKLRRIKRGY